MLRSFYKGRRVVVTGHTGFKGSWLATWLHSMGARVFGYALEPAGQRDNFVACKVSKYIDHTIGDVRDLAAMKQFFADVQPDVAFHLAAQSLVLKSYAEPASTFETNVMGTVNFFEAVRSTPAIKAAVNVTSDKCYENMEWDRGYKETDPMGGRDPYSASKGAAEVVTSSFMRSFFQKGGCNVASARAGNVIGGGDWADNRIVPDFFRALEANNALTLRYPNSVRPWQHVLEPLSGYLYLGAQLGKGNAQYSGGWNFGPMKDSELTVAGLVERLIAYGKKGSYQVEAGEDRKHEAGILRLDISKAFNDLGWKPALNVDETIAYTWDGYADEKNSKDLFASRITQINNYTEKARRLGLAWAL